MKRNMRHTKIVATVGPASSSFQTLEALIGAGVDVFRLNFSHGTHESHHTVYNAIRAAAQRAGRQVGIMQDLAEDSHRTARRQHAAAPRGIAADQDRCRRRALESGHDLHAVCRPDPVSQAR